MNTEKLQSLLLYRYRYAVAYFAMVTSSVVALVYHLRELFPGVSPSEVNQGLAITQDATTILEQGIYLPYNVLQTISIEVFGESALALRLPSVIFGLLLLIMMFALIHLWHKEKIAIITVIFLATSSWFLTFARSGTPYIYTAFCVVLIFLSGTMLRHSKNQKRAMVFAAFALPLTLYSPYIIYLLGLFVVLYRKELVAIVRDMDRSNAVVLAIIGLATTLPLLYSFVSSLDNLQVWLGVSDGLPSIRGFAQNILAGVEHILWRSSDNPEFHLGNLAMLDIFTSTMAALGLYHYEQHFKWMRTRFIIYGLGLTLFVFGLSSDEGRYFMAAPIIYILAATGIVTLLNQWNRIFPYNPFARTLALLPLALALLITSQYHLDRYFSAWAYSPNTRKVYAVEPSLLERHIDNASAERVLIVTRQSEHRALRFLLNDSSVGRSIDIIDPAEGDRLTNFPTRYDVVYLDGNVDGDLKRRLDAYISETIENERLSRPISYRVYDLSTKVGTLTN